MNLFKELSEFNLSNLEEIEIFDTNTNKESESIDYLEKKIDPKDILYDKTYKCPVCQSHFKSKALKSGKNKLLKSDTDLKGYYDLIDPNLYEVIHCSCGYTAISQSFNIISPSQKKLIKEAICKHFKCVPLNEYRTIEDAIKLYKLALLNTIKKNGKNGEKGLICLKLAWLYRDLEDNENEMIFLEHALNGLSKALETEYFPLFYLEENTTIYIVANICHRLGNDQGALKWLSYLIFNKDLSTVLKQRVTDLKNEIKESKQANL